jgi:hypothetical protein
MMVMMMAVDGWDYANARSRVVVVMTHADYNLSDFQLFRPRR